MSLYADVRTALETQLATVSGIPASSRRASENDIDFTVPTDRSKSWLTSRLDFGVERLIAKPANGGTKMVPGTWRLKVSFPTGIGTTTPDTLTEAILAAFPAGKQLTSGSTTVRCDGGRRWGGGHDPDANCYTVPVDLYWHVLTTNTVP